MNIAKELFDRAVESRGDLEVVYNSIIDDFYNFTHSAEVLSDATHEAIEKVCSDLVDIDEVMESVADNDAEAEAYEEAKEDARRH